MLSKQTVLALHLHGLVRPDPQPGQHYYSCGPNDKPYYLACITDGNKPFILINDDGQPSAWPNLDIFIVVPTTEQLLRNINHYAYYFSAIDGFVVYDKVKGGVAGHNLDELIASIILES